MKKGMTEDEMVGWHHWFNGHESEGAPGDGERHGSLACCNPWGCKKSDTTEKLNSNNIVPLEWIRVELSRVYSEEVRYSWVKSSVLFHYLVEVDYQNLGYSPI